MQEERKPEEREEAKRLTSPFLRKLENYWYHYKWQTLIGAFALVMVIVCLSQCSANGAGEDAYILYAGNYAVPIAQGRAIKSTIEPLTEDWNEDGKIMPAFASYGIYSNEELQKGENNGERAKLSAEAHDGFQNEIWSGNAAICLLSPMLFEEVAKEGGFMPVSEYADLPDEALVLYKSTAYGVKLSALGIYTYPGFSSLPEDTILCVRNGNSFSSLLDKDRYAGLHAANVRMAQRMIALEAKTE